LSFSKQQQREAPKKRIYPTVKKADLIPIDVKGTRIHYVKSDKRNDLFLKNISPTVTKTEQQFDFKKGLLQKTIQRQK